jgi:hypothetical protein
METGGFGGGFDDGFGGPPPVFMFFFILIAVLIIGTLVFQIGKSASTWSQNNAAPHLTRNARIVSKRTEVWGGSGDSSAHTTYYITFEFADGSRLELSVKGEAFGLLAEGDTGTLQNQGTRFLDFYRS